MQNSLDTCLKETNRRKRIKLAYESHECLLVLPDSKLFCLASKPSISYLVLCDVLESSPNNIYVKNKICDIISSFNLKPNNLILLLTDAASYMVLGGEK
ncbi:hypothetical protein A3Q56_08032 [Intoshia linei]|uniref:Uncharacterized protein n=1 Tax=Intoshia linei TaxID=1819745 RepID=A0A177ARW6_9BILA|nr:hypothetical protein A3Q56_08032 [Intoshia linei]